MKNIILTSFLLLLPPIKQTGQSRILLRDISRYKKWNVYTSYDVRFDVNKPVDVRKNTSPLNIVQDIFIAY